MLTFSCKTTRVCKKESVASEGSPGVCNFSVACGWGHPQGAGVGQGCSRDGREAAPPSTTPKDTKVNGVVPLQAVELAPSMGSRAQTPAARQQQVPHR